MQQTLLVTLAAGVFLLVLAGIRFFMTPALEERRALQKYEDTTRDLEDLRGALGLYRFDIGGYPTTDYGLGALLEDPGLETWSGPYLEASDIPTDPWGNSYVYRSPGDYAEYDLLSYGADGSPGGAGDAGDIIGR